MASFSNLRDGLDTRLATISGLETYAKVLDSITPPCAVVGVPELIDYDLTYGRGADTWYIPLRVYVGRVDDETAQDLLDSYLDSTAATSVKAAIEADVTLGGVAHTVRVTQARNYGQYQIGGVDYLGCEWLVQVIA